MPTVPHATVNLPKLSATATTSARKKPNNLSRLRHANSNTILADMMQSRGQDGQQSVEEEDSQAEKVYDQTQKRQQDDASQSSKGPDNMSNCPKDGLSNEPKAQRRMKQQRTMAATTDERLMAVRSKKTNRVMKEFRERAKTSMDVYTEKTSRVRDQLQQALIAERERLQECQKQSSASHHRQRNGSSSYDTTHLVGLDQQHRHARQAPNDHELSLVPFIVETVRLPKMRPTGTITPRYLRRKEAAKLKELDEELKLRWKKEEREKAAASCEYDMYASGNRLQRRQQQIQQNHGGGQEDMMSHPVLPIEDRKSSNNGALTICRNDQLGRHPLGSNSSDYDDNEDKCRLSSIGSFVKTREQTTSPEQQLRAAAMKAQQRRRMHHSIPSLHELVKVSDVMCGPHMRYKTSFGNTASYWERLEAYNTYKNQ